MCCMLPREHAAFSSPSGLVMCCVQIRFQVCLPFPVDLAGNCQMAVTWWLFSSFRYKMRQGCPHCHWHCLTRRNLWFNMNSLLKDGDIKNTPGVRSVRMLLCWLPAVISGYYISSSCSKRIQAQGHLWFALLLSRKCRRVECFLPSLRRQPACVPHCHRGRDSHRYGYRSLIAHLYCRVSCHQKEQL